MRKEAQRHLRRPGQPALVPAQVQPVLRRYGQALHVLLQAHAAVHLTVHGTVVDGAHQEVATAAEGHAHGRVDVALPVADHRPAHTGREPDGALLCRLHPAVGLLLLQLQGAALLLLLPGIGAVAAPHLHVAEAHRHAAVGIHHHAGMGEDAVLLFIARTVAEVPVIKRQATVMAEHDFRRVLDAEHVGEAFTTSCARD